MGLSRCNPLKRRDVHPMPSTPVAQSQLEQDLENAMEKLEDVTSLQTFKQEYEFPNKPNVATNKWEDMFPEIQGRNVALGDHAKEMRLQGYISVGPRWHLNTIGTRHEDFEMPPRLGKTKIGRGIMRTQKRIHTFRWRTRTF